MKTLEIVVAVLLGLILLSVAIWACLPPPRNGASAQKLAAREQRPSKHVVYFAWVDGFREVATAYIDLWNDLAMSDAKFHIVLVGSEENRAWFKAHPRLRFDSLREFTENQFEYQGIARAHELALQVDPNELIAYFHSRGTTHADALNPQNKHLFDTVIGGWRTVERVPEADVWAFLNSDRFPWFNFWWARAEFLRTVETPVITSYRHYYEDYLSHGPRIPRMYSLKLGGTDQPVSAQRACELLSSSE